MAEVKFPVCRPREYFEGDLGLSPELVDKLVEDGKIKIMELGYGIN